MKSNFRTLRSALVVASKLMILPFPSISRYIGNISIGEFAVPNSNRRMMSMDYKTLYTIRDGSAQEEGRGTDLLVFVRLTFKEFLMADLGEHFTEDLSRIRPQELWIILLF